MNTYLIKGADKETGMDRTIKVEAPDAQTAAAKASDDLGIMVETTEPTKAKVHLTLTKPMRATTITLVAAMLLTLAFTMGRLSVSNSATTPTTVPPNLKLVTDNGELYFVTNMGTDPVIINSSLINDQYDYKCRQADLDKMKSNPSYQNYPPLKALTHEWPVTIGTGERTCIGGCPGGITFAYVTLTMADGSTVKLTP